MGQRTAIILQHLDKREKTDTRVFYCGWGIGRIMPSQFMGILYGTLTARPYSNDYLDMLKPIGTFDITEDYSEENRKAMNDLDFCDPEAIGNMLPDNNNGGIFVRITTDEQWEVESIQYAYMLGYETKSKKHDRPYKKFCSEQEWMEENGGEKYIDKRFLDLYKKTIMYFEAKEMFNEKK